MTEYRRACIPGATWFFTVNLADRHGKSLLVDNIDLLRRVFRDVKDGHPFASITFIGIPLSTAG
jgi:putative transposase